MFRVGKIANSFFYEGSSLDMNIKCSTQNKSFFIFVLLMESKRSYEDV